MINFTGEGSFDWSIDDARDYLEKLCLKPGTFDRHADAIKTMDGVKGITGTYSFDSDNNPIKSVAIIELTGGEEVFKEMF